VLEGSEVVTTLSSTEPAGPRIICLLGMHRSGTSVAARFAELAGVHLGGPERLMPPGPDNPAGYFEHRGIKELDDELLAALGGSWDRPPVLPAGWEHDARLDHFRARADAIMHDLCTLPPSVDTGTATVGWKDPRLCLLLPFWRTVRTIDHSIHVIRDPLEVIASLGQRNNIPAGQGAVLWLRYVLSAMAADPGALVVRHSDLFENSEHVLDTMAEHLELPSVHPEARTAALHHLDPGLRHNVTEENVVIDEDPLTKLAVEVWAGGSIDASTLGPTARAAIADGWLRPPTDDRALTEARARVVELTEQLRKANRARRAGASR
jgi:hypothetical protein